MSTKIKIIWTFFIAAILSAATLAFGQSRLLPAHRSAVIGVWRGETDNLPAVLINITDESGKLSGAALFYLHKRETVKDPYTSIPGLPEPLFNLSVSGRTLRFEISHRRAHPPGTLHDAPVHFRLAITSPNRAELVREAGANEPAGPPVVMVRSDY
jgi:hypothetical protein